MNISNHRHFETESAAFIKNLKKNVYKRLLQL